MFVQAWVEEQRALAAQEEAERRAQEEEDALVGPEAPSGPSGHATNWGTHMRPGAWRLYCALALQLAGAHACCRSWWWWWWWGCYVG
jgi:hypothetical protein